MHIFIEEVVESVRMPSISDDCMPFTELQRRVRAMKMRCYCKILSISYNGHVTNEEVCGKIQKAIGPQEYLLIIVKRHILQWYGHVSRS